MQINKLARAFVVGELLRSPQRRGRASMQNKLARAFVVGELLRSAKGAARTTSRVGNCFAPHSVLREFLSRA